MRVKKKLIRTRLFGPECFDEQRGTINIFLQEGRLCFAAGGGSPVPVGEQWFTWLLGRAPSVINQQIVVPDFGTARMVRALVQDHPLSKKVLFAFAEENNPMFTVLTRALTNHLVRPPGVDPNNFDHWCAAAGLKGPVHKRMHAAVKLIGDQFAGHTANDARHYLLTLDTRAFHQAGQRVDEVQRQAALSGNLGAIASFEPMFAMPISSATRSITAAKRGRTEVRFQFDVRGRSELQVVDLGAYSWSPSQLDCLAQGKQLISVADCSQVKHSVGVREPLVSREMPTDVLVAGSPNET